MIMAENTIETSSCILTMFRPDDRTHAVRLNTDNGVRRFLGGPVPTQAAERTFGK